MYCRLSSTLSSHCGIGTQARAQTLCYCHIPWSHHLDIVYMCVHSWSGAKLHTTIFDGRAMAVSWWLGVFGHAFSALLTSYLHVLVALCVQLCFLTCMQLCFYRSVSKTLSVCLCCLSNVFLDVNFRYGPVAQFAQLSLFCCITCVYLTMLPILICHG